jgi:molybdopterin-binding protein
MGVSEGNPDRRVRELIVLAPMATLWHGEWMRLSTRNQLPGVVTDVHHGESISTVKVELRGGGVITSAITREAAEDLGLAVGGEVTVLVKATDVTLAVAE